jgi:short subunit dehydrogenase-like uncharacterized protein
MKKKHGRGLGRVRCRFGPFKTGVSGGTSASFLEIAKEIREHPSMLRLLLDPYSFTPEGSPRGRDRDRLGISREDGRWTAPFVMGMVNSRVVQRSNALLGYGSSFSYDEGLDRGAGVRGFVRAATMTIGLTAATLAAPIPGATALYGALLPKPGEGPSREMMARGFFRARLFGESDGAPPLRARALVEGKSDPSYSETSKMIGQCALSLALDPLPAKGGVLTPAAAMGGALVERLRGVGMTFQVEDAL